MRSAPQVAAGRMVPQEAHPSGSVSTLGVRCRLLERRTGEPARLWTHDSSTVQAINDKRWAGRRDRARPYQLSIVGLGWDADARSCLSSPYGDTAATGWCSSCAARLLADPKAGVRKLARRRHSGLTTLEPAVCSSANGPRRLRSPPATATRTSACGLAAAAVSASSTLQAEPPLSESRN